MILCFDGVRRAGAVIHTHNPNTFISLRRRPPCRRNMVPERLRIRTLATLRHNTSWSLFPITDTINNSSNKNTIFSRASSRYSLRGQGARSPIFPSIPILILSSRYTGHLLFYVSVLLILVICSCFTALVHVSLLSWSLLSVFTLVLTSHIQVIALSLFLFAISSSFHGSPPCPHTLYVDKLSISFLDSVL